MKNIARIALTSIAFALSASSVFAQAAVVGPLPPQHRGSGGPLYFIHALGIDTTVQAADALWKDDASRALVLKTWRLKTFGY